MATPNYSVNYEDQRFKDVEADKEVALNEVDTTYGEMIGKADKYYQDQIKATEDWKNEQTKLQNEQTDFAIQKIEQQREQAKKDYTKEQSGAYVDWQKQSNRYGANAEQVAAGGMTNTGFSESSQVSMFNTYQNRLAMARESMAKANLEFDNGIREAQLQNSSILAEIHFNAFQKKLELSLQGFQYKNQLILEKANKKTELDNTYYARYQDVLKQINQENALAEEVRQYNATLAEQQRQHNAEMAYKNAALAEEKRQFNITQAGKSSGGNGGKVKGGRKGTVRSYNPSATSNSGIAKDGPTANATLKDDSSGGSSSDKLTYTDLVYTVAQMRKKGAEPNDIYQYLNGVINSSNYKPTTSKSQDLKELKSAYVGVGR